MAALPVQKILRHLEATEPPRQPPPLADELLEEIFLRAASPADLARASAACVSFRRLIADPAFLHRYRSLHPPLLLGLLCAGFRPVEAPHPNAPAARALACAADFSFDYLPRSRCEGWFPCDLRDGRILLKCGRPAYRGFAFPDLAVCDPLSQRYMLLPPIPDDLLATLQVQEQNIEYFDAFLVPSGHVEETSFKVISRTHCAENLVIFVFSSGSGGWNVGKSISWDHLSLNLSPEGTPLGWPQYEHGCFYWKVELRNMLLKLDISRMEFSTVDLPLDHVTQDVIVVDEGEDRLTIFSKIRHDTFVCRYTIMQSEGESANEWQIENTISLPCQCYFAGALEGYIFLLGFPTESRVFFSLEIKTLKIERVSQMKAFCGRVCPYFGFPPFMSPRRI